MFLSIIDQSVFIVGQFFFQDQIQQLFQPFSDFRACGNAGVDQVRTADREIVEGQALTFRKDLFLQRVDPVVHVLSGSQIRILRQTVRAFVEDGSAVLLGTDTFWTGVDVPGEPLSQVVITRLPFENPNHPLLQARAERVLAEGGKPFVEITLPAALIKFRQGVGRLIRNARDKGIVAVLDSRICSKSYGKNFADAIPTRYVERFCEGDIDTLIADVARELGIAPKKRKPELD